MKEEWNKIYLDVLRNSLLAWISRCNMIVQQKANSLNRLENKIRILVHTYIFVKSLQKCVNTLCITM